MCVYCRCSSEKIAHRINLDDGKNASSDKSDSRVVSQWSRPTSTERVPTAYHTSLLFGTAQFLIAYRDQFEK